MKIVHIFSPTYDSSEGLWSIENDDGIIEYERIFEIWEDPEYIYNFCVDNLPDIHNKFGYDIDEEAAANELMDEAEQLKQLLYDLAKRRLSAHSLQQLFRPLYNQESNLLELQLSKGSIKNQYSRNPKLRIYAVRIGENTYVITGGAIKLTNLMQDRAHTQNELTKLKRSRDWLKSEGIHYPEDLKELI